MGTFKDLHEQSAGAKPGRVLTLPPTIWATTWDSKPMGNVAIGLRLLSEADLVTATAESVREAEKLYPDGGDEFVVARNGFLLRWMIARGICDPNNADKPSEILPLAEDMVRDALTDRGARWLFEEIERYHAEVSPIHRPVTDEELRTLAQLLSVDSPFEGFDPVVEVMCRRLLSFVLQELDETAEELGGQLDA